MTTVAEVRQAEPRHPDQAVDVRLENGALVLLVALPERLPAERETGRVHQDVEAAELRERPVDEGGGALRVGDVERERHDAVPELLQPLGAPRPRRHADALAQE